MQIPSLPAASNVSDGLAVLKHPNLSDAVAVKN